MAITIVQLRGKRMMISCPLCEKQEKLAPIQEPFLCQNFTKEKITG
jgi:hypothetical protein